MNEEKVLIKDLKDKEKIQTLFLVANKNLQTDKNGKSYMNIALNDKSGKINAMMWDNVDEFKDMFQVGDVVRVKGHVNTYQNRNQIVIHYIEKASKDSFNYEDFYKESEINPSDLFDKLCMYIDSIKDENIKKILTMTIEMDGVKEKLFKYPAAKTIHHAKYGGLLEHIISICGLMEFLSTHYKGVNKDLLIFGAIYHDIGKLWELSVDKGFQYTTRGRLIGHITIACELIDELSGKILGFPVELKDILKHIVLSHHGKVEYGSPKRPKFLEAYLVAAIDELDSKMNTMQTFMNDEREHEAEWTRYSSYFDRYLYLNS